MISRTFDFRLLTRINRDFQRNCPHRSQVGRDILAHFPVAARRALAENAIPIMEHDTQPINFWLDGEFARLDTLIQLADAFNPGPRLLCAKSIRQAENRAWMTHLLKFLRNRRPGALAG